MGKLEELCAMLKNANIPYEVDASGVKYINGNNYLHAAVLFGNMETYGNMNQHYGSRTDWRENLSVEEVFNRIKWCHDDNKPLEYVPPHGKTMEEWQKSGLNFEEFVSVGDVVDIDIYDNFLNILPPAYNGFSLMQVGEVVDYIDNKPTYYTFVKNNDGFWVYRGECHWGSASTIC